jgi:hypothetical protein
MDKTQTFNDGIVVIYAISDDAPSGKMPIEKLTQKYRLNYDERTVGTQRFNLGLRNGYRVDMLLRCPLRPDVFAEVCAAIPIDGEQYIIRQVQHVRDAAPVCMDLSLERLV